LPLPLVSFMEEVTIDIRTYEPTPYGEKTMELTFERVITYLIPYLLKGVFITVSVSFFALFFGAIGGLLLALIRVYRGKVSRFIMIIISSVFRALPQTVLLLLLYFVIAGSINISAYWAGTLSLSIISCVYQMEIFRSSIESIDGGQMMAARAIGMSNMKAIRVIILPQALRRALPAWANEAAGVIKGSSLVYIIGVVEVMRLAQYEIARSREPFAVYFSVALIYFVIVYLTNLALRRVEKKLRIPDIS